jgi:hypothetical protein
MSIGIYPTSAYTQHIQVLCWYEFSDKPHEVVQLCKSRNNFSKYVQGKKKLPHFFKSNFKDCKLLYYDSEFMLWDIDIHLISSIFIYWKISLLENIVPCTRKSQ